jgi:prepilin-type N-terminal cleavage/methylation domain-containing protein
MKNQDDSNLGFTLVEMMVVIVIIALLSIISVPILSQMKAVQEFSGAQRDILQAIRQARAAAIQQNEAAIFSVNKAAGTWEAFVDSGGGAPADPGNDNENYNHAGVMNAQPDGVHDHAQNRTRDAGERLVSSGTFPNSVIVDSISVAGNIMTIRFDNRGFPLANDGSLMEGTITLKSDLGGTRNIQLYQSGHSGIQ